MMEIFIYLVIHKNKIMAEFVGTTKVNQGRITIPEAIRNMYSIGEGDIISWYRQSKDIIIVKKGDNDAPKDSV